MPSNPFFIYFPGEAVFRVIYFTGFDNTEFLRNKSAHTEHSVSLRIENVSLTQVSRKLRFGHTAAQKRALGRSKRSFHPSQARLRRTPLQRGRDPSVWPYA